MCPLQRARPRAGADAAATPSSSPSRPRPCPFIRGELAQLPRGRVNYTLRGPAGAPLVACVHGLHGSLSTFASLEPQLVAFGFRVLAFDLYGFGLSAAPRGLLDHRGYAEQLASLLDALVGSQEPVLLLGFSMGGLVAVEFASRWPQRVRRLLLVAPAGLLSREDAPCQLLLRCLRGRCGCCLQHLAAGLMCCCGCVVARVLSGDRHARTFEPDVREPEKFTEHSQRTLAQFRWDVRRSVNSYLRVLRLMPLWEGDSEELYAWLAGSGVPVMFLWGDDDQTVPWSDAEEAVGRLFGPGGATSCVLLHGAGHGMVHEDAFEVAKHAAAWLGDSQDPAWKQCLQRFLVPRPEEGEPGAAVVGSPAEV
ncbi:unnamed protein product [Prorocentrum cordatum]|uniref:Serine aminopeptidase S33 domain-containing protein n=1 Tax=Prorocentrum cordatum TaxID=2364126 RepID=A0ABN9V8K8_9DINO|nr:unnamed protein product [Polarella glacialis]